MNWLKSEAAIIKAAAELGGGYVSRGIREATRRIMGDNLSRWEHWWVERIASFGNVPPKEVPIFKMPEKYKNNWHIYLTLRSDARVLYSSLVANHAVPSAAICGRPYNAQESKAWCDAFDAASDKWEQVNPMSATWPENDRWPEGAEVALGEEALLEARELAMNTDTAEEQ
jgi:hypothetical protein